MAIPAFAVDRNSIKWAAAKLLDPFGVYFIGDFFLDLVPEASRLMIGHHSRAKQRMTLHIVRPLMESQELVQGHVENHNGPQELFLQGVGALFSLR